MGVRRYLFIPRDDYECSGIPATMSTKIDLIALFTSDVSVIFIERG